MEKKPVKIFQIMLFVLCGLLLVSVAVPQYSFCDDSIVYRTLRELERNLSETLEEARRAGNQEQVIKLEEELKKCRNALESYRNKPVGSVSNTGGSSQPSPPSGASEQPAGSATNEGISQTERDLYHRMQGNPRAIDRINQGNPRIRRRFLRMKGDVVEKLKENLRRRLAERLHTDPENIKVVTNSFPRRPGDANVGHDVDMSARVRIGGRDVEIKGDLLQDELNSAYKEVIGNPTLNPEDANVRGVSYHSKEGLGAYPGEFEKFSQNPELPAHDPQGLARQWGEKVENPAYEGHQFDQQGEMSKAELKRYESQRELAKMGRETIKRVEAHGGKVSEHVKKSLEIVDQIGKPGPNGETLSPEEIESQLRARGEIPGTLRSKLESYNEGADVLRGPGEGISDEARRKTFTERVKDSVGIKRMEAGREPVDWEGELRKPSREGLRPGETRTGYKPLTEGRSSFTKRKSMWEQGKEIGGKVLDATIAVGMLASGARKEAEDAAKENREFSKFKVVENVGKGIYHGSVVNPYKIGNDVAREELSRLPEYEKRVRKDLEKINAFRELSKEEQDKIVHDMAWQNAVTVAAGRAAGKVVKGFLYEPYEISKEILEEEALNESNEARRAGEGNKLSTWRTMRYKTRAFSRVASVLTGVNAIEEYMLYDSEADRRAANMQRRLNRRRKVALLASLSKVQRLKEDIEKLKANSNVNDPEIQKRLRRLNSQYIAAIQDVKEVNKRIKGSDDAYVERLRGEAKKLTAPSDNAKLALKAKRQPVRGNTSHGYRRHYNNQAVIDGSALMRDIQVQLAAQRRVAQNFSNQMMAMNMSNINGLSRIITNQQANYLRNKARRQSPPTNQTIPWLNRDVFRKFYPNRRKNRWNRSHPATYGGGNNGASGGANTSTGSIELLGVGVKNEERRTYYTRQNNNAYSAQPNPNSSNSINSSFGRNGSGSWKYDTRGLKAKKEWCAVHLPKKSGYNAYVIRKYYETSLDSERYTICYGPDTFEACRSWLFRKGYW